MEGVREFQHAAAGRVICGSGALREVGTQAAELGGKRVLIVTDSGIAAVGHSGRARLAVEAAGLEAIVYDQVRENPDTDDVSRCLAPAFTASTMRSSVS